MFNSKNKLVPTPSCSNNAFTLAEVLITLVIIGVIAAMTVPTLMNNTNNEEFVSKLKKAYSTLAQATNQIIMEEGHVQSWGEDSSVVHNFYKSKLINAKECGAGTGCFEQGKYKFLNGGTTIQWDDQMDDFYKLILADGIQIRFEPFNPACSDTSDRAGAENVCMFMEVDLNGMKKPNTVGRDVFVFLLKKDGLFPSGCDIQNKCNKNNVGYACACKVLREGAMNY
ncbi:type II secretion system protein [bacterium]|nr:type II secretion system protein [bacterium]